MRSIACLVVAAAALVAHMDATAARAAAPRVLVTAADPTGSRDWGLRVFVDARGNRCLQVGQVTGRGLQRVLPGDLVRDIPPQVLRRCSPPQLREGALLVTRVVDDPRRGRPKLNRMIVAGLAGDSALRATITWRGGRRVLHTRRFGAYLAVLPRSARQRDVRISVRHRDGKVTTVDYRGEKPRWRALPGSVRVELVVPNRVTTTRQGLLVWRIAGGMTCHHLGDLVDGEVGSYHRRAGTLSEYPVNDGANCADRSRLDRPIGLSVSKDPRMLRVMGLTREDVTAVDVSIGGRPFERVPTSRSGLFALIRAAFGAPDELPEVRTRATLRDGTVVEETFGAPRRPPGGA